MKTSAFELMLNLVQSCFAGNRGSILVQLLCTGNVENDEIPELLRTLEKHCLYDGFQREAYPITSMACEVSSAFEHAKVAPDSLKSELVQEMLSQVTDMLIDRVKARRNCEAIWGKFDEDAVLYLAVRLRSALSEEHKGKADDLLYHCGRSLSAKTRDFLRKPRTKPLPKEVVELLTNGQRSWG